MATKTEMAHNREIDQVLGNTGLGSWVSNNRNLAILIILAIFAAVFGWGGYSQMKNKNNVAFGDKIFAFQEAAYTQLIDKKLKPADYLVEFKSLQSEVGGYLGLAPVLIKSSGHLIDQGAYKEAIEVLELGHKTLKTPVLNNIISLHLAAAYEDLKDYKSAIRTLEDLNTSSFKLMEDKVYLDLGRLYIATQNIEKAKLNLNYLVENGKDAEFIKLAKLYLIDLK